MSAAKGRAATWGLSAFLALTAANSFAANDLLWREVSPDNLIFMDLHEGRVTIELNPRFAPETVEQFRRLVQERFYDGLSFYRVIDGFVAQGGDGSDLGDAVVGHEDEPGGGREPSDAVRERRREVRLTPLCGSKAHEEEQA